MAIGCELGLVILFRVEHVEPIWSGDKTHTRRLGKKRWRVGALRKCYTRPPFAKGGAQPFAIVRILRVWREALGAISEEDARKEGYKDRTSYLAAFARINRVTLALQLLMTRVWCVEFELVEKLES